MSNGNLPETVIPSWLETWRDSSPSPEVIEALQPLMLRYLATRKKLQALTFSLNYSVEELTGEQREKFSLGAHALRTIFHHDSLDPECPQSFDISQIGGDIPEEILTTSYPRLETPDDFTVPHRQRLMYDNIFLDLAENPDDEIALIRRDAARNFLSLLAEKKFQMTPEALDQEMRIASMLSNDEEKPYNKVNLALLRGGMRLPPDALPVPDANVTPLFS